MTAAQARILLVLGALVAAVAVATIVLLALDSGNDEDRIRAAATVTSGVTAIPTPREVTVTAIPGSVVTVAPPATSAATRAATATPSPTAVRSSVLVRATGVTNVRTGPGVGYQVIGTLQPGDDAPAVRRDESGLWLLLQGGAADGWVAAEVVEVTGDLTRLPATAVMPTASPTSTASATGTPATSTPIPTRTPAATAITGAPSLSPAAAQVGAAGRLNVVLTNAGPAPLQSRRVTVTGTDDSGTVVFTEATAPVTIPAGGVVNIELGYRPPTTATAVTLTVIPDGGVAGAPQRIPLTAAR